MKTIYCLVVTEKPFYLHFLKFLQKILSNIFFSFVDLLAKSSFVKKIVL